MREDMGRGCLADISLVFEHMHLELKLPKRRLLFLQTQPLSALSLAHLSIISPALPRDSLPTPSNFPSLLHSAHRRSLPYSLLIGSGVGHSTQVGQ